MSETVAGADGLPHPFTQLMRVRVCADAGVEESGRSRSFSSDHGLRSDRHGGLGEPFAFWRSVNCVTMTPKAPGEIRPTAEPHSSR